MPAEELADRRHRTLDRAEQDGATILAEQRAWLDDFKRSDVELFGDDPGQQAVRWNLFQLAQASAQTQEQGIAAQASPAAGTKATTSGTPRRTSCRSSPTPVRTWPAR